MLNNRTAALIVLLFVLIINLSGCNSEPATTTDPENGESITKNGFELNNATVPVNKILRGGPPRDGIPSIDSPLFLNANEADHISDNDKILGVQINGIAKAYPILILNWHEIVNDHFGNEPYVITYCPLCGSGVTFNSKIIGRELEFGVSGLLYNSDVLLYDRQTESLWSQILMESVSGEFVITKLTPIATIRTTWARWKETYPNTLILSDETGFGRDYTRSPYGSYDENGDIYFPVDNTDAQFHPKNLLSELK